jgi:hypothetical protein
MQSLSILALIPVLIISACNNQAPPLNSKESNWSLEKLETISKRHLDPSNWDDDLYRQDIETYKKYAEILQGYPLNKSPFPVATYDYAVSSTPFDFKFDDLIFKGISIGEFENPKSENIINKLTLMVLTNDDNAEESSLVESRNYPYLTAQGYFKFKNHQYDWVFASSPDGYSTLILNMKLFELRFGETILIFPQEDQSFHYLQLEETPADYDSFDAFTKTISNDPKVLERLGSMKLKGIE